MISGVLVGYLVVVGIPLLVILTVLGSWWSHRRHDRKGFEPISLMAEDMVYVNGETIADPSPETTALIARLDKELGMRESCPRPILATRPGPEETLLRATSQDWIETSKGVWEQQ